MAETRLSAEQLVASRDRGTIPGYLTTVAGGGRLPEGVPYGPRTARRHGGDADGGDTNGGAPYLSGGVQLPSRVRMSPDELVAWLAGDRAADLAARLSVVEKATVISVNGGAHGWASAEFALHVTGYTECSHASGSPHGSASSPHNGWRVTVFPAVMSTAAAFSRELVSSIAYAIGHETRAKHNNETGRSPKGPVGAWAGESILYCFAPMINVCRDPRWGRCQEGNGEDPFLAHEFGRLYVEGYQDDEGTGTLKAATPKHFDVFAGPNNAAYPSHGHMANDTMPNKCNVDIGLRDWMTTFQPAFRGAIIEGKARSVMCILSISP